ncbi:P-loop containing nucleoside triphosphate hydrolase protein [Ephemerocybe angulata]|uniref:P-loop containing nucleoside triphosphate hydrolase protein n=1 Tax=Ephemerocybe angulata TaxID=980116 RepID=A0A8H6M647_9AGAR|nr:P-loop containing nucleoside triphosphate hydrolase protein [Tulosesus angulatus]
MGATGSGKSTFINTVSGTQTLKVSSGMRSCTSSVQTAPPFVLDGRIVTLIDTPGFDDTTKSDTDILKMIAHFLTQAYQNGKKLAGVIYIHRISDFRMGGISTRNFRMFRQLCGDSTLKSVVILTNMWGQVGKEVGEAREHELASDDLFFKPVLDKGANMVRHDESLASAHRVLRYLIHNDPSILQIVREIAIEKKDISETAAGEELNKALIEQMNRHKKEMAALHQEYKDAMEAKDEETKREIEAEAKKLQAEMARIENESKKLLSDFQKEKGELEQRMKETEEESKREQQRIQEQYRKQIEEIERQRNTDTNLSKERQADFARQIEELRRKAKSRGWFSSIGRAIDSFLGLS